MSLTDKDIADRQSLLCRKYDEIKRLISFSQVPHSDRDDLAQEIFAAAYNKIHQIKDMECLNAWIYQIARRQIMRYRLQAQKKREREIPYETCIEEIDSKSQNQEVWEAMDQYMDEELYEMVMSLKPPAPYIIELRFAKGYSLKEIAEMLDMNYNSVKTIEHRAFQKLKKMIKQGSRDKHER